MKKPTFIEKNDMKSQLTQWVEKSILEAIHSEQNESMSENPSPAEGANQAPKEITVHFLKSNFFRVIHADGVWGGATPTGREVAMNFYSEQWSPPSSITIERKGGKEVRENRVTKNAPDRELECCVIMDLDTAKALHIWLGARIEKAAQAAQAKAAATTKTQ